jgi:hypothetical protein
MSKRIRRNWQQIKQDYLISEDETVQDFLKTSLGLSDKQTNSGFYKAKTKGWSEEKKDFRKDIYENAKNKIIEDTDIQDDIKKLLQLKELAITLVSKRFIDFQSALSMQEIKVALDIIKRELGEPLKDNIITADVNIGQPVYNLILHKSPKNEE